MDLATLRRFAPLYSTARYLAADRILRRHLGLPDDYPLPVGLSHGVDFGQMYGVLDEEGIEPIYWAYNPDLLRRAVAAKPAIGIPHPFLLASGNLAPSEGRGTLIIGPPPGPAHDRNLYDIIRGTSDTTILVKPKLNYEKSVDFWLEHGFDAVTLADEGPPSYEGMVQLFSRYSRIAGCTFSSALFFAAALGKPVDLIRGYRCRVWEVAGIEKLFDFRSTRAPAVGSIFAGADYGAKTALARRLLGSELDRSPTLIKAELDDTIGRLEEPVHFARGYPSMLRPIATQIALLLNKPGLLMRRPSELARLVRKREIVLQDLDDVSLWIDGPSVGNPQLTPHRYVPGRTVPGDAVEAY
jgi:hypothetical protein